MLPDLQVGDCVTVKRNLDHPAWMTRVAVDPRSGGNGFVRRTDLNEVIGDMAVIQRVADHFRGKTFVRLANGLCCTTSAPVRRTTPVQPSSSSRPRWTMTMLCESGIDRAKLDANDPDDFWCDCTGCEACVAQQHHRCLERDGGSCRLITGEQHAAESTLVALDEQNDWFLDQLPTLDPFERSCWNTSHPMTQPHVLAQVSNEDEVNLLRYA